MNKLTQIALILLFYLALKSPVHSQGTIPPTAFNDWVQLEEEQLSADGKWVSFQTQSKEGKDSLFLYHQSTQHLQKIPKGIDAAFSPDSRWFTYTADGALHLFQLDHSPTLKIQNGNKIGYDPKNGAIAVGTSSQLLYVYASIGAPPVVFEHVRDFSYSATGVLAVCSENGIALISSFDSKKLLVAQTRQAIKLQWDASGAVLYYFDRLDSGQVTLTSYTPASKTLLKMSSTALEALEIEPLPDRPLQPAAEAKRCFFYAKTTQKRNPQQDPLVEVWDALSPLPYSAQKQLEDLPYRAKLYSWELSKNQIVPLELDSLFSIKILPSKKQILAYNPIQSGQLHLESPITNYYLSTIGQPYHQLLLRQQSTAANVLMPSPDGRYLGYCNAAGWHHYDCITQAHRLVVNRSFIRQHTTSEASECTSLGWTTDSSYCLLQVGLELWLVRADGKEQLPIASATDPATAFKIAKVMHKADHRFLNEEIGYYALDLKKGLFLQAYFPDKSMGFYKWTPKKGLQLLYKSAGKIAIIAKDAGRTVLMSEETAQLPPALLQLDCITGKATLVYQSNVQYKKYGLPRVELLSYSNAKGEPLQALLHYPVGYEATKTYPMLVYVYEKLSQNRHSYYMPSPYDATGFALANYTNDGYFVLQPDIRYSLGDPGSAVLDAVEQGVSAAFAAAPIDSKKLGIIGHSYGGHEVALTIAKTHLFAAAVSGAAATNMISDYLRLNAQTNSVQFWKYEKQQYRMGASPFGNWDAYAQNSPVLQAEHIATPLLSWTGKADGTVDWTQSVELHMALKRLQKRSLLLAYPDEGHILTKVNAQKDLTQRIKEWFDLWLK